MGLAYFLKIAFKNYFLFFNLTTSFKKHNQTNPYFHLKKKQLKIIPTYVSKNYFLFHFNFKNCFKKN